MTSHSAGKYTSDPKISETAQFTIPVKTTYFGQIIDPYNSTSWSTSDRQGRRIPDLYDLYDLYDVYDLDHVAGCEPHNLNDEGHVLFCFFSWDRPALYRYCRKIS